MNQTTANQTSQPAPSRPDGRAFDQLRPVRFTPNFAPAALGSVLIQWGNTHVICAVSAEAAVPKWMRDQNVPGGWITAEYSMLPYSTAERKPREVTRGKPEGRTQEIQRIIGRAMRAAVNLELLGELTLWVDCDVVQADGGTRAASVTGAYVALVMAIDRLLKQNKLTQNPLLHPVAAVSAGIVQGTPMLDLCYSEDSAAEVDMTLIMTGDGRLVEVHAIGEEATFTESQLSGLLALGRTGLTRLFAMQRAAIIGAGVSPELIPTVPCPGPSAT